MLLLSACTGEIGGPLSPSASASGGSGGSGANGSGTSAAGPTSNADGTSTGVVTAPLNCEQVHVGFTPLQRLSRAQYTNTVRDLLKVNLDSASLSEDERVGIFAGNTIAPVNGLVVDQYAAAATRAAAQALPNLEKLVPCERAKLGDPACAAQFIEKFGLRVYRRPLLAQERASYVSLFQSFQANGYADALRTVVQTMLQSPNFIYRIELKPVTPGSGEGSTLDAYELAARLSFFLLSTTPDDALLESARSGALLDSAGLQKETARLLADPRFGDTLDSFHLQWLELDKLEGLTKDSTLYPSFTPELSAAMRRETLSFVRHVINKDHAKLDTLLTASYSFPQGPLLGLYGLDSKVVRAADEPVALDPNARAGLFTQPAFLAVHAHYNQTSPVARGKVIIRNVLCQTLPDPPPEVNTTPADPSTTASTRQRLLQHQNNPSCSGCHKRIDGIGLGFEQFDAIGAGRTMESGQAIDSSGEVLGTRSSNGSFNGAVELAHKLAASSEVQQCVATQWLRFALGRMEASADACARNKLFEDFASSDHDIRALLQAIVQSDTFRMKRVASAP
jgi:hypothetical protein